MNSKTRISHWLRPILIITTSILGILSLIYPFLISGITNDTPAGEARAAETPLLLSMLLGLCLLVLVFEIQGQVLSTKLIALLGILVAINATLRFIEVGIPGPGGFSPIFFLIILTGYVFGAQFGFLMGVLTIFVSGIMTGGVGPWLPSQMFAAGWVGMSAAILPKLLNIFKPENLHQRKNWGENVQLIGLVIFGFLWGLLYGLIMNLWSWPYLVGPENQYWVQGISFQETISRYLSYYLFTSFVWDLGRAIGTAMILLAFGVPVLRTLRRFQLRFSFTDKSQDHNIPDRVDIQESSSQPAQEIG